MRTNLYHVIYKMPAFEKEDMFVGLEELAVSLVKSGLLRIDAEPKQNFVRFSMPSRNVHVVFSKRELYDSTLLQKTSTKIRKLLLDDGVRSGLEDRVNLEIEKLKINLKKFVEVDDKLELKVARILVQSAHPVAIQLIILENVEIYISFGHNIGEVMDIASWKQAGSNSGMQSTDGKNVAVFVSCGGDPLNFDEPEENNNQNQEQIPKEEKTTGDGIPALARMMGIAGQEIGHYSDIYRDRYGRQVGRYSADFGGTRANPNVNAARLADLASIESFENIAKTKGLDKLIDIEKKMQFFEHLPKDVSFYLRTFRYKIYRTIFVSKLKAMKIVPITELKNKRYIGMSLSELISDMAFNLAPVADVYSNPDKNVEIAIACIEALARVPQQANKWGHLNTLFFWRKLYKIYYYQVIPGCIKDYENITGKKFTLYPNSLKKYTYLDKIKFKLDNIKLRIKKSFRITK